METQFATIKINEIYLKDRKRQADSEKVKELSESIKTIGLLNPISVSKDAGGYRLIAGLHRLSACKSLSWQEIPANILELNIINSELAEIDENLIRAELHYLDRAELLKRRQDIYEELYPLAKAEEKRKVGLKNQNPRDETVSPRETPHKINTFVSDTSKKTGLSDRTIQHDLQLSKNLDTDVKNDIKKLNISKQDAIYLSRLDNDKQKAVINKIKESPKNKKVKTAATAVNKEIKSKIVAQELKKDISEKLSIRHCGMQELLSDKTLKIDAIITDPPYVKESLHLFEELAKLSKDIPLVAVMTGQYHLPEILEKMCKHLKYRWTFAYLTPGGTNQQYQKKVNTAWKPVVLFGEPNEWIPTDVVTSNSADKEFHIWGQSISGFTELIERLTSPGQLVCDPFLGGGTTAVACLKTGRRFIGCDIDENNVKTAVERCNQKIN
jgi:ParB/RepB/Spo0J family partition protein